MYDSVSIGNIPKWAQIVAAYVDGHYKNFDQAVKQFPNAYHVSITVFGQPGARVCDTEPGDLTPTQAAAWAKNEIANGRRPTIYTNLYEHPQVVNALAARGLQFGRDVDWWAAGYTGHPYLASGSVATQYADPGPYDISDTNGVWPYPVAPPPPPFTPLGKCIGMARAGTGYWLANSDGTVAGHGAMSYGGIVTKLVDPICGITAHPSGKGYWLVASDGGVFSFGASKFYGSTGNVTLTKPVVGMSSTPTGDGYWLVAADGGVFAFGDAGFYGSTGGITLNQPVVGMIPSPSGNGYFLVAADGGVFTFGDAVFQGSTGGVALVKPIIGVGGGKVGYWLAAADGGVFAFGQGYMGSTANVTLNAPVVGMVPSSTGNGYALVASDGGVFTFGDFQFKGAGAQ